MPSRLKGIETLVDCAVFVDCAVALDMPSRLKGIETSALALLDISRIFPLDMPSRLKGIETRCNILWSRSVHDLTFGYAFPFEGNWNSIPVLLCCSTRTNILWICLPVWRELKHYDGVATIGFRLLLWICLPVWRELKPRKKREHGDSHRYHFGYAFPFEGNWNIKTNPQKFLPFSGFGYAFPFEGNWNFFSRCVW